MSTWLKNAALSEETLKKDFSDELATQLPIAQKMAQSGSVQEACELLLVVEKQARNANDLATLKDTCLEILKMCYNGKNFSMYKEQILILTKRRGQKSAVISAMVQDAQKTMEEIQNEVEKVELIEVLRTVTDGKIYAEKERAQLTQALSQIKEKNGDVAGAADILQEVHVETYGAMTKKEKCEFILEQVRLTLLKKDYIRSYILSKKILRRTLEEEGFESCKLKFYKLMIEYHVHENDTTELCRHWMAILNTPCIKDDLAKRVNAMESAVLFAVLSPYSNHQADILQRLLLEPALKETSRFKAILNYFTTNEVIPKPLSDREAIANHPSLKSEPRSDEWLETLTTRIIEHVRKYYLTSISPLNMYRMSVLYPSTTNACDCRHSPR